MTVKPLRPHENRLMIQAEIEGLTLVQLHLRNKLVEKEICNHESATAYVRQLNSVDLCAHMMALFAPEEEMRLEYV